MNRKATTEEDSSFWKLRYFVWMEIMYKTLPEAEGDKKSILMQ